MRLGLGTLGEVAGPRVDPRGLEVGVVHLGLGAFHRAHQALYTEDAVAAEGGAWGICGASRRSRGVVDALAAQDGLYGVLERGPEEDRVRVVGVLREALVATQQPDALRDRLAAASTHVVTLTVTEAGYRADDAPGTPVGILVRGLEARRAAGVDSPLAIVSCDNLPRNGEVLRGLVHAFCADAGLADWIAAHADFPSTMVDRIVPATTAADRDVASRLIGARDEATVVGEPFSQWVIEDAFRGRRPAWEAAGAMLVPDTRPYEAMKLRLLNGGHSALAYLGLLRGHETVAEAIADPELDAFLERLLASELAPTLGPVPRIDLDRYRAGLLARWSNPRMAHRLEQIGIGGAMKLPPRLLAPARELLAEGGEPAGICLAVAAWLRRLESAARGPLEEEVAAAVAGAGSPAAAAERALAVSAVFGEDLRENERFRDLLADGLAKLTAAPTVD
ncbi:MAG: mannitol dehydrogenase family protein [Solirubrobacteraceae bacterium]